MPTEAEIVDQIAEYCEWLEGELGAPMHRSRVVTITRAGRTPLVEGGEVIALSPDARGLPRRSRLVFSVAAAALVATGLTTVYALRRDSPNARIAPPPAEITVTEPVIESTIDTTNSSTTVPALATEAAGYAPVDLPDDLVVWDVGWATTGGTYGAPFVEQLFGTYDATNTLATGMLIHIQSPVDEVLPDGSIPRVTVRGVQGYLYDNAGDPVSLMWVEGTREISVRARGLTLEEALPMLDAMQWRADGSNSFEPTSITLPLVSEADSGKEFHADQTHFLVTHPDGLTAVPTPIDPTVNPAAAANAVLVIVGPPPLGSLAPGLMYEGERRADGSVVDSNGHFIVEPDGTIVQIMGGIVDDDGTVADRVAGAIRPIDGAGLTALVDSANQRLGQLAEVASSASPNGRVVLRGGTAVWPVAICLVIDQVERCRSSPGLQQTSHWQTSVLIDGRWFLIGRQPAADPSPVVFPWTVDMSPRFPLGRIIEPTDAQVVGTDLLWYAEIPTDLDAVGIGYVDNGNVVSTTPIGSPRAGAARRPDA